MYPKHQHQNEATKTNRMKKKQKQIQPYRLRSAAGKKFTLNFFDR